MDKDLFTALVEGINADWDGTVILAHNPIEDLLDTGDGRTLEERLRDAIARDKWK